MTKLTSYHTFVVRKANGIDDFRIRLRAGYWGRIESERKLRSSLLKAINDYREGLNGHSKQSGYAESLQKKYDAGNILEICRTFGIIQQSERISFNQK